MAVRSEYQRKYRDRNKSGNIEDYELRLTYRTQRRLLEHKHTPIGWETNTDELEGSTNTHLEEKPHDVVNAMKKDISTPKEKKTTASEKMNDTVVVDEKCLHDRQEPQITKDELPSKRKISKQVAGKRKINSTRQKARRSHRNAPEKAPPPMIPYGMAYQSVNTDKKRTFNVLAADEVFPSAIRAAKRREVESRHRKERKRLESERKRADSVFNLIPIKQDVYLTEYQRNFCIFTGERSKTR